jgi:hypothetical protein
MMKKAIALIACAAGLSGCASTGSGPIPHLSDHDCQKLVTAVDRMAMIGGIVPDEVEQLNPLQVYTDHGNVVIALERDAHGEQGFYIIPTMSAYDPRNRPHPNWTFTLVNPNDSYVDNLLQYSRR